MVGLTDQNIHLNARIRVGEDFGRILYMGPVSHHCHFLKSSAFNFFLLLFSQVEGHDGLWIGIEWDDPMRGRHNGTVKGSFYFETR